MSRRSAAIVVASSVAVFCSVLVLAQPGAEKFTATASMKTGTVKASAEVTVSVTRYASEEERAAILKAAREGGSTSVRKLVSTWPEAGSIQVGERRTPLKFAGRRTTPSGNLITVVTGDPILHLGAGLPDAKPTAGYDVAVAILDVQEGGGGVGEFAPAAKVGVSKDGALLVQDYGATVLFLSAIARAK